MERSQRRQKQEKIALITGASSGLGKQYLKALSKEQEIDAFWVIARRKEKLEELRQYTSKPVYVLPFDLTKQDTFDALETLLSQRHPNITYLIANAGMGLVKDTKDMTIVENNRMIDLNIKAVINTVSLCLPYMQEKSNILIISSLTSYQPLPGFNIYASTKAFLRSYSYSLHEELLPQGIHVTCVCPYWIKDTEFIGIATDTESNSYGTIVFPVKSKMVVTRSLKDLKKNRYLSSPGIISSTQRVITHIVPTGVVTKFMDHIRK